MRTHPQWSTAQPSRPYRYRRRTVDRNPFRILAVAGSLRQGSYNQGLLRAAEALALRSFTQANTVWVELQPTVGDPFSVRL